MRRSDGPRDWNVTARAGAPFIKRYREERELTVLFLVDVSASGMFGTGDQSKLDLAVEVAGLLMFSALKNNDKVGLALFCDDVLRYFPPRKGKGSVLRLLRELIVAKPVAAETRIDRALEFLGRVQKRRAVVFLMSDFIGPAYEKALAIQQDNAQLLVDLAMLLLERRHEGDLEEAWILVGRAESLAPRMAVVFVCKAEIVAFRGNLKEAVRRYVQAIDLLPKGSEMRRVYTARAVVLGLDVGGDE